MTTARKIIERAFSKAGIRAAETPLEASEISDGLDVLNDMLVSWDATNTLKGVPPVMNADDELAAPRYAIGAIKANVAILIAGEYGITVTQSMAYDASNSLSELVKASINLRGIEYPSTLPVGSGNRDEFGDGYDRKYFPEDKTLNF